MKNLSKIVITLALAALVITGMVFVFGGSGQNEPAEGLSLNGVNLSGLNKQQAEAKMEEYVKASVSEVTLDIIYEDKVWSYNGESFEARSNAREVVENIYKQNSGGLFRKLNSVRHLNNRGLDYTIILNYAFKNIDEEIESVITEIERPALDSTVDFKPENTENMFVITKSQTGIVVNRERLKEDIVSKLIDSPHALVYVQVTEVLPEKDENYYRLATRKIASFSTDYTSSGKARRDNIKLASEALSGMMLEPGKEYSFNSIVGARTGINGYKEANIIYDGKFEKGVGGGVCQVSTTLYNALVRADIDITEVSSHSLPISYVPLAEDAMVSYGSSDLKFINTSKNPCFLKLENTENKLTVTVFGNTLTENEYIKVRSEKIREIPHGGDKVVPDTDGVYSDKIMFKGEYIRYSYPKVGYEAKAYKQKFAGGKLVEEKLIRHEKYLPQQGLVYEGADDLPKGFSLPESNVQIIKAQTKIKS